MSPLRRKGFTAKQSKRTSSRMQSSTLGSHVQREARRQPNHMNAQSVGFSNARRGNRAVRGEVRNIGAQSTTRESRQAYSRRTNRTEFAQGVQRKSRFKSAFAVVAIVALVLVVGIVVGVAVLFGSLSSNFALSGSDAPSTLVAQTQGKPYYVVVSADLDGEDGCDTDVDALALVRVDESSKQLTILSVPTNLAVKLSDGETHAIADAVSLGGYSELVKSVASLAGVDVSHFVKADEAGIRQLASSMGGVTLNLSEEVDDPDAGYLYIPAGLQTLDGDQLMTFLRASNYKDGADTQRANQALFFAMVVEYLSKGTQAEVSQRLDAVPGSFQTDWSGQDLVSVLSSLSGFAATGAYRDSVPGYLNSIKDDALYVVYADTLASMMANIEAGQAPSAGSKGSLSSINPGAYTVTVRNGSGITGGASAIADILSGVGFKVTETGNADSYVYNETLVVYGNDSLKDAADAAASVLGVGRSTESGVYYTYDTDLLVILGSDWKPTS